MIRSFAVAAICVLVALLAACGSADEPSDPSAQPEPTAEEETEAPEELVGTWKRLTTCSEIVNQLEKAGLKKWIPEMVAGNGFVPGVRKPSQLKDPSSPCRGSVPREHSHFFTQEGAFGSLDWNGNPVDDGSYELTGVDTFAVSKEFPDPVTFNYSIDGDTLMLDPVVPDCSPQCFEAPWSISVAYPGEEWHRVE